MAGSTGSPFKEKLLPFPRVKPATVAVYYSHDTMVQRANLPNPPKKGIKHESTTSTWYTTLLHAQFPVKVVFDEDLADLGPEIKALVFPDTQCASDETLRLARAYAVKGKVVVIADYGAFVEIQPGVEGLIHVSEMSWSQHLRSAQEFLHVGDEVEAVILSLDRQERKMSLGIKQLKEDPWENIEQKYPVGSKHTAKVRNFTNFGIFVEAAKVVVGVSATHFVGSHTLVVGNIVARI